MASIFLLTNKALIDTDQGACFGKTVLYRLFYNSYTP
jgi:hypothetical protein